MSSILFERKNNVVNPPFNGVLNGNDGQRMVVATVCAPSRILLRCRYAEVYLNSTVNPVLAPYNIEGPYLRIYPATSGPDGVVVRAGYNTGTTVFSSSSGPVAPSTTLNPTSELLYYEIDANNCSVYLPFDATLELYTDFAGVWIYDVIAIPIDPLTNTVANVNLKQTRRVAPGTARTMAVPTGAHAVQLAAASTASMSLGMSDAPKTVGVNSDSISGAAVGSGFWPYAPGCLGNARTVTCTNLGAEGADAAIIFGIQIP